MSDLDFIEEIRVAQYWRKQLGEAEYVRRDPDDLFRWYKALETRGPDEIRDYLNERGGRHPAGEITGIVSKAPHPSREIIDLWLESHRHVSRAPYWLGFSAFMLLTVLIAPAINGCQNLKNPNPLAMHPPAPAPLQAGQLNGSPPATATMPAVLPMPASVASPPAGSQNGGTSSAPR